MQSLETTATVGGSHYIFFAVRFWVTRASDLSDTLPPSALGLFKVGDIKYGKDFVSYAAPIQKEVLYYFRPRKLQSD